MFPKLLTLDSCIIVLGQVGNSFRKKIIELFSYKVLVTVRIIYLNYNLRKKYQEIIERYAFFVNTNLSTIFEGHYMVIEDVK